MDIAELQAENTNLRARLRAMQGKLPPAKMAGAEKFFTLDAIAAQLGMRREQAKAHLAGCVWTRDGNGRDCVSEHNWRDFLRCYARGEPVRMDEGFIGEDTVRPTRTSGPVAVPGQAVQGAPAQPAGAVPVKPDNYI